MSLPPKMAFRINNEKFEIFLKEEDDDVYDLKLVSRK